MRTLLRILLFWAVSLPLFYLFGVPYLLDKLSAKTRADNYAACITHMQTEFKIGTPAAIFKLPVAEEYCHCLTNGLTFNKADLPELMKKQTPARMTEAQTTTTTACNQQLQDRVAKQLEAAPPTRVEYGADGRKIIHIQ